MAQSNTPSHAITPRVAPVRRIVTGHDQNGQAIIVSDAPSPHVDPILGFDNFATTELWSTAIPADNNVAGDPVALPHRIAPADGGAVFRVVEFPPDRTFRNALRADQALTEGSAHNANKMLHRTRSIDFAVVVSGEIWCVMDEGEVLMRAGDTMVQRGTNHDWQNRSDDPTRVAFVLIDAVPLRG